MPIRVLPETVAAQIAAGEVIERPASVVKELIENALDAGAHRIDVEIRGAGLQMIRVRDDGQGIPAAEIPLAVVRHATSKLQTLQDLDHLQTLGFRGEALASIVSVAQVTLTSRHVDALAATRLVLEGGRVLEESQIGAGVGTSLEVANLFYNVPARLKFLKSEATEKRHIINVLSQYAMAYPHVSFALYMDGGETLRTAGNGQLADVLVETLGLEQFRQLIPLQASPYRRPDVAVNVTGYISTPHQTRSNRSHITLFVNGRNVQDQRLSYAVVQGYHGLIPQGRYPVAVLMITLDPSEVDVNVHPTKAEVRFRHPDAVFSALQRAVRETLQQGTEVREIASAAFIPSYSPPAPNYAQTDLSLELDDAGRRPYETRPADADEADFLRHIPEGVSAPAQPRTLPPMRIIGQLAAMYILAEAPAGLYLIDQHAAHERILYEQFLRQAAQQKLPAQRTLQGSLLRLPPASMKLLEEHLPTLAALGFELEPFGTDTFQVRAIPALLADYSPEDVLGRILQDLEDEAQPGQKNLEDKILRRVCKTAAVKAGQLLSYDEMLGLLRQLERCETPLTCPHGRPTLIHLSKSDLAREFGRT